jgi:very-short-patch-repair endonuclease
MKEIDETVAGLASSRYRLFNRDQVLAAGGNDDITSARLGSGRWVAVHPGVYSLGPADRSWRGRLSAAVLAAGDRAAASHRAGLVVWGLDGIEVAPLELTVPVGCGPVPEGAIVHRTRRPMPIEVVDGIPVTSVERTLIDAATQIPFPVLEKAYDSALRRHLTSEKEVLAALADQGGRGVRGGPILAWVVDARTSGKPAGSPAEVDLDRLMRKSGLPAPVRQYRITLPNGSVFVVDFGWPDLGKAVEVDGLDAHASAQALDQDLDRQNLILGTGLQLRRFSARAVRKRPKEVIAEIAAFLRG